MVLELNFVVLALSGRRPLCQILGFGVMLRRIKHIPANGASRRKKYTL